MCWKSIFVLFAALLVSCSEKPAGETEEAPSPSPEPRSIWTALSSWNDVSDQYGELPKYIKVYKSPSQLQGKKSVAFNLVLRADDRSLTAEEADEDVKSILETLAADCGAALR